MSHNSKSKVNEIKKPLTPEEMEIIQEKFDDMLISSLARDRVVNTLEENHPLVKKIRVNTIKARNDGDKAKTHVIFKLVDSETKKAGFLQNPDLSTSAGYITWIKSLNLPLPQDLTQDDWDKAADLASGSYCSKRTALKKDCIKGAFSYQWTQDGKAVAPKDLRPFFTTTAGRKQLVDWIFKKVINGPASARSMFEPTKPLLDFVHRHMCDYSENYSSLDAALASMASQKNSDKLARVEADLNNAYEQARDTRENEPGNNNNNNANNNGNDVEDLEEQREIIDLATLTSQPEAPANKRQRRSSTTKEKPAKAGPAPKKGGKKRKSNETDAPQSSPKVNKRQKGPG